MVRPIYVCKTCKTSLRVTLDRSDVTLDSMWLRQKHRLNITVAVNALPLLFSPYSHVTDDLFWLNLPMLTDVHIISHNSTFLHFKVYNFSTLSLSFGWV